MLVVVEVLVSLFGLVALLVVDLASLVGLLVLVCVVVIGRVALVLYGAPVIVRLVFVPFLPVLLMAPLVLDRRVGVVLSVVPLGVGSLDGDVGLEWALFWGLAVFGAWSVWWAVCGLVVLDVLLLVHALLGLVGREVVGAMRAV